MRTKARSAVKLGMAMAGTALAGLGIPMAMRGPSVQALPVHRLPWVTPRLPADSRRETLRVMTLNVAHGRRDGFHQALQQRDRIEKNLSAIAGELERVEPDLVALQEADGPSIWSGRFDHVRYLCGASPLPYSARAEHVRAWRLSYGTALVSATPLKDASASRFRRCLLPKGFLAATLDFPSLPGGEVDVVSLHLDSFLPVARRAQAADLVRAFSPRRRPLVIMGDFNCGWRSPRSGLRVLASALGLKAYRPGSDRLSTYPRMGRRLDWILVSPELEFRSHRVLTDPLSDHRAVVADLVASERPWVQN